MRGQVGIYPVQPGLSRTFTLALETGAIHCWGEGWNFDNVEVGRPDRGIPSGLDHALDALIEGAGRIVTGTAYGGPSPFWISLQVQHDGRWQAIQHRALLAWPPFWQRSDVMTHEAQHGVIAD